MSDEEQLSGEEEEYEEEEEQEAEEIPKPAAPKPTAEANINDESLTEAEKAMLAAKKRQDLEDNAKLKDYEEHRRIEREREEEEVRKLKEKQEQRRMQREEEEREMAERRQIEEERRRLEEEERRVRLEEERLKKEEEKRKRQAQSANMFGTAAGGPSGRNFTIPEKKDRGDKFGNIVQAKQEMGMTKEQQEEQKRSYLAVVMKQIELEMESLSGTEMKGKMKELHHRICKLETEKYDLEKRHERQEYDLKELNERQRQVARNRALKKGLDPADVGETGRYPPKVSIFSKYDRQIDRRNFKERRAMFDKPHAFPCFPNVAPPPTVLEFKLKEGGSQAGEFGVEEEVEEEEYEEE